MLKHLMKQHGDSVTILETNEDGGKKTKKKVKKVKEDEKPNLDYAARILPPQLYETEEEELPPDMNWK